MKDTNPKELIASGKLPLHLFPNSAVAMGCLAFLDGALKYGRTNWRESGAKATTYYDALFRHMGKYMAGEDIDPESGIPHLSCAIACLAILIDAEQSGSLVDDRHFADIGFMNVVNKYSVLVPRLIERHKDKTPRHFTIRDNTMDSLTPSQPLPSPPEEPPHD